MSKHEILRTVHVVVMGVSGCGKTTVAEKLRDRTGWAFAEADDFHSQHNKDKMHDGIPLTDADRRPWLEALRDWIAAQERGGRSSIMTCSALKRSYRDLLRQAGPGVLFVHLDGDPETLKERMTVRTGHFMPVTLLESQIDTLEPLQADEPGFTVPIDTPPDALVEEILTRLVADRDCGGERPDPQPS